MKSYEFQGKSVEKAIEEGLKQLGKSQFDVDIRIIESGGLFKKAKVEILVEEEGAPETIKPEMLKESETLPVKEQPKAVKEDKPVKEFKKPKDIVKKDTEHTAYKKAETVREPKAEPKTEPKAKEPKSENHEHGERTKKFTTENVGTKVYLEGLLSKMGLSGTAEIEETEESTKVKLSCDKPGMVIGYRGEGLNALQYLANITEQKTNPDAKRIVLDIEGYRERREDGLRSLAERIAKKVVKTGHSARLEPMNAYDRRIIHSYLQTFEGVETHSKGEEPRRFLVIEPKK